MTSRHMWALVCDDVRQEVGNKVSFMGLYGGEIFLPAFPATLPKLCVALYVRTLTSDPFAHLVIRVLKDDLELARIELPNEQLTAMKAERDASTEDGYVTVAFMCQFSPFVIEEASTLRFRAETERETLKGGSVRIKQVANSLQTGQ